MYFYDNFIDNLSQSPMEDYKESTQAFIDGQWLDTNLLKTVEEEIEIGLFKFSEIQVWKNSISDFAINMVKNAKDFRRLMFQDINHDSTRGRFYRFNDNYWIVYEETSEEEMYPEVSVRRCNNIAKWIDKESGNLITIPCVLDYELSSPNAQVTGDVTVGNSKVTLILQGNEYTHKITKNQRFIFNGIPYSFKAFNNYMQDSYVDQNVPLLFMDLYMCTEEPSDNLVDNIANEKDFNYTIKIDQSDLDLLNGDSGTLSATVTFNNQVVNMPIKWSTSDFNLISIDSQGNYQVLGESGSTSQITACISGNDAIRDSINITVRESVLEDKSLVISPNGTISLRLNQSIDVIYGVYDNGVEQLENVNYIVSGADNSYYSIIQGTNKITITNKKQSSIPMVITFTSGNLSESLTINLKALL